MKCPKCGDEIPEKSDFCPECGEKLAKKSKKKWIVIGSIAAAVVIAALLWSNSAERDSYANEELNTDAWYSDTIVYAID